MKKLILTLLFCLVANYSIAQNPQTNPGSALFIASSDHNAVIAGTNIQILTNYMALFHDGTTLVKTFDLGKPTPSTNNEITFAIPYGGLTPQKVYSLTVVAVGPGGTSQPTNAVPFVFQGAPNPASNLRLQQ